MRVFRRRGAGATDGPADVKQARSPAQSGKGRPTPKRSEAERKRYQPITGPRAPAAPRTPEEKQQARNDRARRYDAMKRGEGWALNPRDRGAARALARDFVDSKRRVSEYYMYILIVLVAVLFVRDKAAQTYISPLILVLVVVILLDAQLIRRGLTKLIAERLPGESTRGLTLYAVMRALQIRRFRLPAPRVHPGDKI